MFKTKFEFCMYVVDDLKFSVMFGLRSENSVLMWSEKHKTSIKKRFFNGMFSFNENNTVNYLNKNNWFTATKKSYFYLFTC